MPLNFILIREGPEALVLDLKRRASVEWELLDSSKILDLGLEISLSGSNGLV